MPEIVDYDESMVELKWDAPFRDGGAPITGGQNMFSATVVVKEIAFTVQYERIE